MKIVFELPHNKTATGGVMSTIRLAEHLNADLRFQRFEGKGTINLPYSIGRPDKTFPACDVCVTYSDNPYLMELVELPQVKKVIIYMLSYGMCLERETPNIHNYKTLVTCSTQKIEKAILDEGVDVKRIGFSLEMGEFYRMNWFDRKKYLAILYHDSDFKNYDFAVSIADSLYKSGEIEGVISFGGGSEYNKHKHPKGLKAHYYNASKEQIRYVFNNCRYFLMPSTTEGLNLTPIEATLCGCPSLLVDGAIGEIFHSGINCFVVQPDKAEITEMIGHINRNYLDIANDFHLDMTSIVNDYTIDKVANNLIKLI
jgi:hypothetical protein